jgi:hypothetical protein
MTGIERRSARPHEELAVYSTPGSARCSIDERPPQRGIEELRRRSLSAGERLAMLLESADELELRHHDFRGRPLALFAGFVRRIDQLKAELIDAERYAALGGARRQASASASSPPSTCRPRPDARERGVLDAGDQLIACVRCSSATPTLARGRRAPPAPARRRLADPLAGERELVARSSRAAAR